MRFICGNKMFLVSIYNRRKSSYLEKFLLDFGPYLSGALLKKLIRKWLKIEDMKKGRDLIKDTLHTLQFKRMIKGENKSSGRLVLPLF